MATGEHSINLGVFDKSNSETKRERTAQKDIELSGPARAWMEHIDDSQFFREYAQRLTNGRDMHVIVTASGETGVGKTTLAVSLALLWDQHGWTADKAAVADAKRYSALYDELNPGSALILDEAEKAANSRRAMSKGNVDVADAFAAKRYLQIFGILTAPSKNWVDKRLGSSAADYWIQAVEADNGGIKGEAKVYRQKEQEHYSTHYTKRTETISWPILDDNEAFKNLDERKDKKLSGNIKSEYVHRDEVEEIKDNYWNKAQKQTRFHLVQSMSTDGLSDKRISNILNGAKGVEGLGRRRVNDLVNADSFDDVYNA